MIEITRHTSTTDTSAAPSRAVRYIVIHYTAGTHSRKGAAINCCEWWKRPDTKASADFVVDDETIVQYNPDIRNRYTWHCGGAKYSTMGGRLHGIVTNYNSIGIELCSTSLSGKVENANDSRWTFTPQVLANARKLVRALMEEYGIGAENVVRHWDVNGKLCPGIKGWNADSGHELEWQKFRAGLTEEEKPEGKIKLIVDGREVWLPGRFEDGTNYIAGTVREIFGELGADITAQGTTPVIDWRTK